MLQNGSCLVLEDAELAGFEKILKSSKLAVILTATVLLAIFLGAWLASRNALSNRWAGECPCPKDAQYPTVPSTASAGPYMFALGLISGLNCSSTALILLVIGLALSVSENSRRIRLTVVSTAVGIFYAYLVIPHLMILIPDLVERLEIVTNFVTVSCLVLGITLCTRAVYSLHAVNQMNKQERRNLLPESCHSERRDARFPRLRNLYMCFLIGMVFSIVNIPCTTSLLVAFLEQVASEPMGLITSMVIFDIGVIAPIISIGLLAGVGFIRLRESLPCYFRGRIVQRALAGAAFAASALLLIFGA